MLSLRLTAKFEEVKAKHVTLWLSPKNFQRIEADYDSGKIPPPIKQHISRNFTPQSFDQILILSLVLNTHGRLTLPHNAAVLTPASEHQTRVRNFQFLCQSTRLLLYIPTSSLSQTRRVALERFVNLGATGTLTPLYIDFNQAKSRRGGREVTWDIFNVPHSHGRQAKLTTLKRVREESQASPTGTPLKRLAGEPGAATSPPPAYVCNSDSDTDFSHLLFSPFQPSHAATALDSGSKQLAAAPTAPTATHDTLSGKRLQEAIRAELKGLLRETLPDMLREMLPELVSKQLRDLLPSAVNTFLAPSCSQDSDAESPNFIESIVVQHLPKAVQDYIELQDPLDSYFDGADLVIRETAENVRLEIMEARDESITEVKKAEADVIERLTGVDWNTIGKDIMGLTPTQ